MSTSAALFLHITLYCGHELVMAENSSVRSSLRASSSAGAVWLHNLTSTWIQDSRQQMNTQHNVII